MLSLVCSRLLECKPYMRVVVAIILAIGWLPWSRWPVAGSSSSPCQRQQAAGGGVVRRSEDEVFTALQQHIPLSRPRPLVGAQSSRTRLSCASSSERRACGSLSWQTARMAVSNSGSHVRVGAQSIACPIAATCGELASIAVRGDLSPLHSVTNIAVANVASRATARGDLIMTRRIAQQRCPTRRRRVCNVR
jgi:hypothetical protein